jgi:hypothetical protein
MLNQRLRRYPRPTDMQQAHDDILPVQSQDVSFHSIEAGSRSRQARRQQDLSWALLLHLFNYLDTFTSQSALHRRVNLQFAANLHRNPKGSNWGYTEAPRKWGKEKIIIVIYLDVDWFQYGHHAYACSLPLMR